MKELRRLAIVVIVLSVFMGVGYGYYQQRRELSAMAQHRYLRVLAYEGVFSPELLARFNKASRIKILLDTVVSLPQMQFHLKENPDEYDVIVPYLEQVQPLRDAQRLTDLSGIANLEQIATDFQRDPHSPGQSTFAALLWGLEGLLVDTRKQKQPSISLKQIFATKDLRKKVVWSNRALEILMLLQRRGVLLTGDDPDENTDHLLRALDQLLSFVDLRSDPSAELLKTHSVVLTSNGRAGFAMQQDEQLRYFLPDEGSNLWIMGAIIPTGSKQIKWARRFVNFMLDPKQAETMVATSHQATTLNTRWVGLPDLAHSSYLKKVPLQKISLNQNTGTFQLVEIEKWVGTLK